MHAVIEKLVAYSAVVVCGWFLTIGQDAMMRKVREFQIVILRDVGRTDN
jgi:hypothetical protein